jgi:sterol desaturase/sphingolipid hydroxylase (fatty acid hydroxylase superfamily)
MTPEQIAAVAGFVLSLLLEYAPKFSDWYNGLPDNMQKLVVIALGLVVVGGEFGLGCAGLVKPIWVCTAAGAWEAVLAFVAYLVANQATYVVLPRK